MGDFSFLQAETPRTQRAHLGIVIPISRATLSIMAIFHFSAQVISAADGRSAVAAAAYRRGAQFTRLATGRSHDYTQKKEVAHREIILPPNAPAWAIERYPSSDEGSQRLWNDIEARENEHSRRDTAVLAKELEFSLSYEVSGQALSHALLGRAGRRWRSPEVPSCNSH